MRDQRRWACRPARDVLDQQGRSVRAAAEERRRLAVDRQAGQGREAAAFCLDDELHALFRIRRREPRAQELAGDPAGLLRQLAGDHQLVLLEEAPGAVQAPQQARGQLRVSQERSPHARVGGVGGARGNRLEPSRRLVMSSDQPRLREREARVLEQGVDDRRQRIEAERGELRLLGGPRLRGPVRGGKLAQRALVQRAMRARRLFSRRRRLVLVQRFRPRHGAQRGQLFQRRLDALGREPGDHRQAVQVGEAVQPRGDEAFLRRERKVAKLHVRIQRRLPRRRLRLHADNPSPEFTRRLSAPQARKCG